MIYTEQETAAIIVGFNQNQLDQFNANTACDWIIELEGPSIQGVPFEEFANIVIDSQQDWTEGYVLTTNNLVGFEAIQPKGDPDGSPNG